jgi:hypothetical protein
MRISLLRRVAQWLPTPPSRSQFAIRSLQFALLSASTVAAQSWNSPAAIDLAQRAVARRSGQIAASALASYSAKATGYLTFLGQVGDTAIFGPKVIKQTQLAVDVYWHAPGSSKQIVRGMRDTLLTPADIGYYSDRFGIVQSNFPDRIRMGDGLDVADVMHPLSPAGLGAYDFAMVDSTSIRSGADRIDVYQLMYRPREPRQPRAIGSAYVDVRTADIVRLELTFTRAAILDKRIEYLSVSLENALIEGRAWLPHRQEIEVVRTGTWLSLEARGIIRGRWDVCCYDVEFVAPPALFTGSPISFAPPEQLRAYRFEGGILDSLPPNVAVVRAEDLQRVQRLAEDVVKLQFRERSQKASLSVPHISDIVRVTRTEGLALGAAGKVHPATVIDFDARARYGFGDREWKGELGLRLNLGHDRALRLFALRDYLDARDVPEVSGVRNTIAAQEFGSDYTDPFDVRAAGAQLSLGRWARTRWRVEVAAEKHAPLTVRATPENGAYELTIPARAVQGTRVSLRAEGAAVSLAGGMIRANAELRLVDYDAKAARLAIDAEYERPFGAGSLQMRTVAGVLSSGALPPQLFVYLGGPTTAPGYRFDEFASRRGVSEHVEWRAEIPFFPLGLGRFGRTPPHATLAPFVHAVWVDDPARMPLFPLPLGATSPAFVRGDRQGWYPSVGVGFEPLLGIMRLDVARGLRDGRWTFSADVSRAWWPIL